MCGPRAPDSGRPRRNAPRARRNPRPARGPPAAPGLRPGAGVPDRADASALRLADWVEPWLAWQRGAISDKTLAQKRAQVRRALAALGLETAADLADLARLEDGLDALAAAGRDPGHLRRCYQLPLKQLTAWLARNRRHLPADPLAAWAPYGRPRGEAPPRRRRSLSPAEAARALLALERLDALHGRRHPQGPLFLALLVSGAREGAVLALDAPDLDAAGARLDLGPGRGRKGRGHAALDARTLADLARYRGDRRAGPLFLSPTGRRPTKERVLQAWREAVGLGLTDALWPADAPPVLRLAHLVNRALLQGRARVSRGGRRLRPGTRRRQAALRDRVEALAARLRDPWAAGLAGVDVHALRATHRTWAEARGVAPALIDKQLGHGAAPVDAAEALVRQLARGSRTGARHYRDLTSSLFDPARSAEAVREALEAARADLRAAGRSLLLAPPGPPEEEGPKDAAPPAEPAHAPLRRRRTR